ncbi:hypothetical protein C9J21_18520 [Photobacterium phosphoreum]|uniref:hypothetical protein n=1 Tax=Photobacterium phosphoreum TaxID=659 RepID=UPI000D16B766|nr:hypothetical protein [Photobacterium phosphoreum]PSW30800.1 hypothetical protein C9J21_18520 [Photobacterium phosphoreum]
MKLTYIHIAIVGVLTCASPTIVAKQLPSNQLVDYNGHDQMIIRLPQQTVIINDITPPNIASKPLGISPADITPPNIASKPLGISPADITPPNIASKPLGISPADITPSNIASKQLGISPADITPSNIASKPLGVSPTSVKASKFYISQGQTYLNTLNRWISESGYSRVAWSIPNKLASKLNDISPNGQQFIGDLPSVVHQLGQQLGFPKLKFSHNYKGLAALHTFSSSVDIYWVDQKTLKNSLKVLTQFYGWHWLDSSTQHSWLIPIDQVYFLNGSYPIVVPRGDFSAAVNTIIDGYPIQAQIDYGTKTIYVVEK